MDRTPGATFAHFLLTLLFALPMVAGCAGQASDPAESATTEAADSNSPPAEQFVVNQAAPINQPSANNSAADNWGFNSSAAPAPPAAPILHSVPNSSAYGHLTEIKACPDAGRNSLPDSNPNGDAANAAAVLPTMLKPSPDVNAQTPADSGSFIGATKSPDQTAAENSASTNRGTNAINGDTANQETPSEFNTPSDQLFEISKEDSQHRDQQAGDAQNPWGPSIPSAELTALCQRAEQAARRGFDLAERGALFSARSQFISALHILSEAIDAQHNTNVRTKALGAGLRAIEEVGDFAPRGAGPGTELNMQLIVDAHHTPVLKRRNLDSVTPAEAQRLYLTFAQEQLAAAGGDLPVASLALHGLGKICIAPAEMHGPQEQIADAKAVVYFQAALLVEPNNFMAANELGVRLVRFGRFNDARMALEHAVAVSGAPTSWRNLAVVCDKLGDSEHAAAARQGEATALAHWQQSGNGTANSKYPIQWVDPDSFSATNSMVASAQYGEASGTKSVMAPQPTPAPAQNSSPAATVATKPESKTSFWPWSKK